MFLSIILVMALGFIVVYDFGANYAPLPYSMVMCYKFSEFDQEESSVSWCKAFVMPLDKSYHITSISLVNETESSRVRSLIFYLTRAYPGKAYFACNEIPEWSHPLFAWSGSSESQWRFPERVGFKIGLGGTYFGILQINFINETMKEDVRPGVRFSITSDERIVDAGFYALSLGSFPKPNPAIQTTLNLLTQCGQLGLSQGSVIPQIFGSISHMSPNGLRTSTFFDNSTLACDDSYDHYEPYFSPVYNTSITPASTLTSFCSFNVSNGAAYTCTSYIAYYPFSTDKCPSPSTTLTTRSLPCH
eukprot:TRINITY_DN7602_c0_g1_i1.p1 TRINITY_DN7602_c0_g1~~TRINITY_DN7602_c0_g1_i1.p1  ORF type:complete len:303 (+),score=15.61 TRINITY_DN7602_c0_g1_i1:15-923(+)